MTSIATTRGIWKNVSKVICVGRNYAEHARELGNAVPTSPVLFLKPPSSILSSQYKTTQQQQYAHVIIPQACTSLHHEVELAVVMGKSARKVSPGEAMDYVSGYALALDMTARDLQDQAKKQGLPWALAKAQDTFTPIGDFIPKDKIARHDQVELWLKVDGELKQKGNTNNMIFNIPYLISYISHFFTLEPHDIILTGTPSGVGPVKAGQVITAGISGVTEMTFGVAADTTPSKL